MVHAHQHADELARQTPELLADLYESKTSDATAGANGDAAPQSTNTIFFHALGAASPADDANTTILRRPAAPVPAASILVVDDNEANRALLTRRLSRNGHTVSHVARSNCSAKFPATSSSSTSSCRTWTATKSFKR